MLPGESALALRQRIVDAHLTFAASPTEALAAAEAVVLDAVAAVNQSLLDRVSGLGGWRQATVQDADQLDRALRDSPVYLDKLLAL